MFEHEEKTAVLGIKWLPKTDELTFEITNPQMEDAVTKRSIVSIIYQLYDPNGLVASILTNAKLLIQQLWKCNFDWDDPTTDEIAKMWTDVWSSINALSQIRIPRWFGINAACKLQLHAFADSSGKAYGGAVYLRVERPDGQIECHLVAAKSRVAPIKPVTIPRLELAAAVLVSQLLNAVQKAMQWEHVQSFLWTDNIAALMWIRTDEHKLRIYVANRVKQIINISTPRQWNHVRSEHNPADLISRGQTHQKGQYKDHRSANSRRKTIGNDCFN